MQNETPKPEGLRERKRRETRRRLAETGLRLFLERGYEETTLDDIVEAAGVSRRTYFHYFDQKEDILLAWQSGLGEALQAALLSQKPDRTPVDAVLEAAQRVATQYQDEELIRIDRLLGSIESLRARKLAKFAQQEQVIFEALKTLWPAPERRGGLRLVAMVSMGALRLAFERWAEGGGAEPLTDHLRRAFADLRAEIAPGR